MSYFTNDDIEHMFAYHAPDEVKRARHSEVTERFREFALWLNSYLALTGGGPDATLAIRHLQDARSRAHTAIALN